MKKTTIQGCDDCPVCAIAYHSNDEWLCWHPDRNPATNVVSYRDAPKIAPDDCPLREHNLLMELQV